jgi:NAD(P)-dependent dehydrogenase (short-subunit alcohol dehydrogenase family)
VDFLINNAMITRGGLDACGYEGFLEVLRVGVAAPYYLTKLLAPRFAPGACVVNLSSTRAFQSQANTESYTAAKGGITALTHGMAVSLAGKARVNAIAPGWIDTTGSAFSGGDADQHPAGRVGKPSDIAAAVLFLCGDGASFITGQTLVVDGGMSRLMVYHGDRGWAYQDPQ